MKRELKPQTPHPRETGKAANGTIMQDAAKSAAWSARWERDFAHRWLVIDGLYYQKAG